MKFNHKGIRFHIWLYFFLFSVAILLLFGVLLNVLIRPYYRNDRIQQMEAISNLFEERLQNEGRIGSLEELEKVLAKGNVCAVVYNDNAQRLYFTDSLGQNCAFYHPSSFHGELIAVLQEPQKAVNFLRNHSLYSYSYPGELSGRETLIYGQKISNRLSNYYLFLNSPLEPVESVLNFIFRQYFYIASFIVFIAFVIAFYLAKKIAAPIQILQKEAKKFIHQDYRLQMPPRSFTEIDHLANTLEDASHKLLQIDELQRDMMANISHDLKTPLTMIRAYGEMIRDISGADALKREEHIEVILKECDYLTRLIRDMQELAQMKTDIIHLKKENFDFKLMILDVLNLLQHSIKEKDMELILHLSEGVCYGDEIKLSQVVYNFILNAIKHCPNKTTIEIITKISEEELCFEVIDQGEGIPENELSRIWDRYQKIDKGFHRQGDGSGLGLAIAKAILEAHHAEFGVESTIHVGSRFYFVLKKDSVDYE